MDTTLIVRAIAGVLAVVAFSVVVYRRRSKRVA